MCVFQIIVVFSGKHWVIAMVHSVVEQAIGFRPAIILDYATVDNIFFRDYKSKNYSLVEI